ncbi:hypothetical protein BMS3Bbin06_00981 [bacterium BMS3Bbin06]|nr:hypothetical protein BMS3Abin08_00868 [bacterium BMS3Abin08]GBE34456.1 hypothetical protein BMS3Bbin06_00981 [bacterium BMS3Bbin06]
MPPLWGSGSVNPRIPCLNGRFPVAMDVQSMGESFGERVARFPITPSSMNPAMLGIFPPSTRRWMIFQSAASHPISRTLPECTDGFIAIDFTIILKKRQMLSQTKAKRSSFIKRP